MSELTEDAVKDVAQTGKAFINDFLDIDNRPVLVVVASKHFPEVSLEVVVINILICFIFFILRTLKL